MRQDVQVVAMGSVLMLGMIAMAQPPANPVEKMPEKSTGSESSMAGSKKDQPMYPTKVLDKTPDQWAKDILDKDPGVAEAAIRMMLVFGPAGRKAGAKNLLQSTTRLDSNCRGTAAMVIGNFGGFDEPVLQKEAISRLTPLLSDPQVPVRLQAVMAVTAIGPPYVTPGAMARLASRVTFSDEPNYEVRRAAATALGRCGQTEKGPPSRIAVVALGNALNDPSALVRESCVQALIILGPPAEAADAALLKSLILKHALADKDKLVALWSRVCLMRMDPSTVTDANFEVIFQSLRSTDVAMATNGAHAVGVIGSIASKAVPDLVKLLDSKDTTLVATSAWALGQMGSSASTAVPKLQTLLTSKEVDIQENAKEAIAEIQKPAKK